MSQRTRRVLISAARTMNALVSVPVQCTDSARVRPAALRRSHSQKRTARSMNQRTSRVLIDAARTMNAPVSVPVPPMDTAKAHLAAPRKSPRSPPRTALGRGTAEEAASLLTPAKTRKRRGTMAATPSAARATPVPAYSARRTAQLTSKTSPTTA